MSEFMFGVVQRKMSKAEIATHEKAAEEHGCVFIYGHFPGDGYKGWFAGPNKGSPFDGQLANRVFGTLAELECNRVEAEMEEWEFEDE